MRLDLLQHRRQALTVPRLQSSGSFQHLVLLLTNEESVFEEVREQSYADDICSAFISSEFAHISKIAHPRIAMTLEVSDTSSATIITTSRKVRDGPPKLLNRRKASCVEQLRYVRDGVHQHVKRFATCASDCGNLCSDCTRLSRAGRC